MVRDEHHEYRTRRIKGLLIWGGISPPFFLFIYFADYEVFRKMKSFFMKSFWPLGDIVIGNEKRKGKRNEKVKV